MFRLLGSLLVAVALVYSIIVAATLWQVRGFRRVPRQSVAEQLFAGNWPHNVLGRRFMFKPGTAVYNEGLRSWAYRSRVLSDSSWNRSILEADVARMSRIEKARHLPAYPLSPTLAMIPHLIDALNAGSYSVIPIIARVDRAQGTRYVRDWVNETLLQSRTADAWLGAAQYAVTAPGVRATQLLDAGCSLLPPAEADLFLSFIAPNLQASGQTVDVLEWVDGAVRDGHLRLTRGVGAVLGALATNAETRSSATSFLVEHTSMMTVDVPAVVVGFGADRGERTNFARLIFGSAERAGRADVATASFHALAHIDVAAAEELARPFLDGSDSELRKGIIVILVRHDSRIGNARIDDAFMGAAPRRTMFARTRQYISGSIAADEYRERAGHDYLETGKRWPPAGAGRWPYGIEARLWREFIDKYPWFPGTDDAYYRMAYALFCSGDIGAAKQTVSEFLGREFPDDDAKPYILRLSDVIELGTSLEPPVCGRW